MKALRIVGIFMAVNFMLVSAVLGQDLKKHLSKGIELYKKGDFTGAVSQYRKVVDILKKGKNLPGAQQIQMNIGIIYLKQKQYVKAVEELEAALALYKKPDKKLNLKLNKTLATAHYKAGNYALRANILEGLLKKYKKLDDKTRADILAELGDSYRRNEIYSKAIDYYQQSLKYYKKLKDTRSQALILTAMGQSQAKLGDFDPSIKSLDAALPLSKKLGNHQGIAEIYSNLGIAYWDLGEYPKALEYLAKAKKVESKENLKRNLGADYNNEGLVYKSAGNYPKAIGAIDISIKIAREIKDEKSEAIALSNHALINRILGKNEAAMKDYQAALKIYQRVKFKEGTASCYLGLGKLYEVDRLDYQKAYEYYQKALNIYRQLGNIAYQAEALNQIGGVLKKGIDRKRTTRDLLFEDDGPVFIKMPSAKAKTESLKAYREALKLATKVGKKEAIWSAQQGIGYALKSQGKEKEAFKYYKDAIDTVVSIRGSDSDSELMGDYLKDKEDLFTEAIEVASALYAKTKDKKYLWHQMEYQEIYKNEVMKNAMTTANLEYKEPQKANLFETLKRKIAQVKKLEQLKARNQNVLSRKPKSDKRMAEKEELGQKKKAVAANNEEVAAKAEKLRITIKELLSKWKEKYPDDEGMFNSAANIKLDEIQHLLTKDTALISYFPLDQILNIVCVTKDDIVSAQYPISNKDLTNLIGNEFNVKNIEKYARKIGKFGKGKKYEGQEVEYYKRCIIVLNKLYEILINPIQATIENKSKLVIVPAKHVAYVPFAALVKNIDEQNEPHFLIYDKTISYMRMSYFTLEKYKSKTNIPFNQYSLIAVGNPEHQKLSEPKNGDTYGLPSLDGAEKEVDKITSVSVKHKLKGTVILKGAEATETAWKNEVKGTKFNIMYFATHGVPYAEVVWGQRNLEKHKLNIDPKYKTYYDFVSGEFTSKSPLNGYLLMGYSNAGSDNGVLTLGEILTMDEAVFSNAEIAVLSACNTAVTFPGKVLKDKKLREALEQEFTSDAVAQELKEFGLLPGVDQICLADTFMRKFKYVVGTLWFAEDQTTQEIMSEFFSNLANFDTPEAMRQAQLGYLKRNTYEYTQFPRHPYFWAVSGIFGQ